MSHGAGEPWIAPKKLRAGIVWKDRPTMDHETVSIGVRIIELVEQHGSLRKAGRVLGLTGQYLYRLQAGEKTNPSAAVLKKLGLRRVVSYARLVARRSSTGSAEK